MLDPTAGTPELDTIAHVVQSALAPAFLLSGLATLLNVFSTRLGRVADKVDALTDDLETSPGKDTASLLRKLAYLRHRSFVLDLAVVLASLAGALTGITVLSLFAGAYFAISVAALLFWSFGSALLMTILAIAAFLVEILLASRGIRIEVAKGEDAAGSGAVDSRLETPGIASKSPR